MATATKAAPNTDELLLFLGAEGPTPLRALLGKVEERVIALAWTRGLVELGKTKYVVTGNPASGVTVHNGVPLPPATVVIEGGTEWPMPNTQMEQFAPLSEVAAARLPVCPRYQKYQLEVCVNREKDVWEWLESDQRAAGRETRYARRDIERAEAESLFDVHVRLTRKGRAALAE